MPDRSWSAPTPPRFLKNQAHPYTRGLLAHSQNHLRAPEVIAIPGLPPDLSNLPRGCSFQSRMRVGGRALPRRFASASVHRLDEARGRLLRSPHRERGRVSETLLSVRGLKVHFPVFTGSILRARAGHYGPSTASTST